MITNMQLTLQKSDLIFDSRSTEDENVMFITISTLNASLTLKFFFLKNDVAPREQDKIEA